MLFLFINYRDPRTFMEKNTVFSDCIANKSDENTGCKQEKLPGLREGCDGDYGFSNIDAHCVAQGSNCFSISRISFPCVVRA